ncbi:MAG: SDR family oxidoreductase [Alphaproteobacteria bacterium]|nr:SDR family oxidoreductase [Alphaproteobacteria bacterium]
MLIEFPDRGVIVSGGGHGFGRAIAQGFAQRGAQVWTCDLNDAALGETCAPNAAYRHRIQGRSVDVGDREQVRRFVAEAEAACGGRIGVLVNNAGGVRGQIGRPLEEISVKDWKAIYEANVDGAFWFAQAVAPGMKAAKAGRVVNISSGAGLGVSLTGIQAYASAKAALIGLTRQLGHELGPWSITVNCVAPGFIRSNPTTEKQWESYGADGQKRLVDSIALKRLGKPEDIVHAVLFFASDQANWITGQTLSVSGGR